MPRSMYGPRLPFSPEKELMKPILIVCAAAGSAPSASPAAAANAGHSLLIFMFSPPMTERTGCCKPPGKSMCAPAANPLSKGVDAPKARGGIFFTSRQMTCITLRHWEFYRGYSILFSVTLLLLAVMLWQLAALAKTDAVRMRPLLASLFLGYMA